MTKGWPAWFGGVAMAVVAGSFVARGAQQRPAATAPPVTVSPERAVLNRYCIGCHNDTAKIGGLSLSTIDIANVGEHPEVWEKVARKLRGRVMPPIGRPRPDEATYDSLVSYVEGGLDRAAAANPNPGRTETFRRLTRTEYQNAIRDLLALDIDTTSLLPKDDASFGFDNVTVGVLSPTLMERYLSAAQKISRLAVGDPARSPESVTTVLPVELTQERHLESLPFGTRGGAVVPYTFPLDAVYEIQLRLYRDRNEHVEGLTQEHQLELTLDDQRVEVFTAKPVITVASVGNNIEYNDSNVDKAFNIRIPVKAGPHVVGAAFLKGSSALLETERQPYPVAFNLDRHPRTQPAVYSVTIAGPFDPTGAGDSPSRHRIFSCRPAKPAQEAGCARTIISALARRAFRRSITADDLKTPLTFYEEARGEGGFDEGIEMAVRTLLVSPEFLFRVEHTPATVAPSGVYRVSDVELASRLSFLLWSSIPDDELLDLAVQGKLRDPVVLEKQVRRMLADPRSAALVNNFAEQWLYLRNLSAVSPDARMFPTFDDNLRQAFRRETELFFQSIVKENRSVLDLLRADYSFLDERLAKHYGIPNVYGTQFRRVTFDKNSVRGGLLGQGSILTATSYANRTSPVLRGKWVLENIIGTPPPAPPPGVPPLKETKSEVHVPTMRERMEEHRANPACAVCHKLMDPIGLSMENFDAIGRFRSKAEDGAAIDASGAIPSGTTFVGVPGLKQALLSRPEGFVTTVTEKLLTYSLGRGVEYYDGPAVRQILRDARTDDYRFATLVLDIVKSTPFQMRRSQ